MFSRLVFCRPVLSRLVFSRPVFSRLVFGRPVFSRPVLRWPVPWLVAHLNDVQVHLRHGARDPLQLSLQLSLGCNGRPPCQPALLEPLEQLEPPTGTGPANPTMAAATLTGATKLGL
eukprot:8288463-Pyramimonas_sp.AAC.1